MPTTAPPIHDRHLEVETPEHVAVGYHLADLGSRFAALLLDTLILGGASFALFVGFVVVASRVPAFAKGLIGVGTAVMMALLFVLFWGYFVYYEGLRDGQTPGKRKLGLRVVRDGGYPVTVQAAAVRNLLRVVDSFPPPTWLTGGAVMMLHPQTKRVGDIAAGTVVVREQAEAIPLPDDGASVAGGAPRLAEAEFGALSRYVARREGLEPEVRARLAGPLLEHLAKRLPDDPRMRQNSPDRYLMLLHAEEWGRRAGVGAAGSGQAAALVRRQGREWAAYRELLERASRRGLASLPESEVSRFAALYRLAAADLARARSYGAAPEVVYGLERSVAAGHNLLYRPGERSWRKLRTWLAGGFPALVRARWRPIAIAAALLYLPLLLTAAAVRYEPARARQILPATMIARAEEGARHEAEGTGYVQVERGQRPVMASAIATNNVQVTFLAFAGGVLAGLGTVLVLVGNGVSIGAVFGLFASYGLDRLLLAFILPHGLIELTTICIAGGAGLWLASGMLVPGRLTRREAVVERGREAVSLLAGTTLLLLVAGLLEGFVSPSSLPFALKAGISALSAVLLGAYLLFAGRGTEGVPSSQLPVASNYTGP